MPVPQPEVVHVVAADVTPAKLDILATLITQRPATATPLVLHVGPGPLQSPASVRPHRVHAPIPCPSLGSRALRRVLTRPECSRSAGRAILHAWSPKAAAWCAPLTTAGWALLIELEEQPANAIRIHWPTTGRLADTPWYICPSECVRDDLRRHGVPDTHRLLIRPGIAAATPSTSGRSNLRARLGFDDQNLVIALLPPITRQSGAFTAAWAALLVERLRSDVSLVMPGSSAEAARVQRLITACSPDCAVRVTDANVSTASLVACADVAAFVPRGDAPIAGVATALVAGCPLVTTLTRAIKEILPASQCVQFCRPGNPQDVAGQMLSVIENLPDARKKAAQAQPHASELFSVRQMLDRYSRAYRLITI